MIPERGDLEATLVSFCSTIAEEMMFLFHKRSKETEQRERSFPAADVESVWTGECMTAGLCKTVLGIQIPD